jgi:hypothetical protein
MSTSAPRTRHPGPRRAFCPFCGRAQTDTLVSDVSGPEGALCVGRCAAAWQVLAALRLCEAESEPVAARKRAESEAQGPRAPALSELLLGRWRAGDWTVSPEDLIGQL